MSLRSLVALSAVGALLTFAGSAAADDHTDDNGKDSAAPAARVVREAETHTDPKSGTQIVSVPKGCTPTTQKNGQVVIFCPFREPGRTPHAHYESKWYGWETLLVDGAALTLGSVLMAAGDDYDTTGLGAGVLITGYAVGGPIVHWSNGQVGKGFASLGLRLGAPIVVGFGGLAFGALLGAGACNGTSDCVTGGAAVGAALGVIVGGAAAIAIDSAALARKRVLVTDEPQEQGKIRWQPTAGYDPKRQAATIGVGGTF